MVGKLAEIEKARKPLDAKKAARLAGRSTRSERSRKPSVQESRPAKRAHEVSQKKARVETEGRSVEATEVSEPPTSSTERPREEVVIDFLLSLRTGLLDSVAGTWFPVCEMHVDIENDE